MKLFVVLLLYVSVQSAWACTCLSPTDEQEYLAASSVLLVQVTSTEFVPSTSHLEFDAVLASFRVVEEYKGSKGELRYLKSEKVTCEAALIAGDYYLVYSRGNQVEVINTCTRSRWINPTREKSLLDSYSNRR